jgi:signal transduction histidine kinase
MIALTEKFERRSRAFAVTVSVILVIAIGMVDYLTGYALVFSAFYLLPVSLAAWYVGAGFGAVISLMSVAAWLTGDIAAGVHYPNLFVPAWNGTIALTVYFVVVKALVSLRKLQKELEERVRQRTIALANEMEERTRLEKELLEIAERGQRQIGHDLHDSLGQHLTATAFASQVLQEQLEAKALPEATAARHLVKMVEEAIALTRTFARGLHPVDVEAGGLMDGFQELARLVSERFSVSCEFECREPVLFHDAACSTHLYRIAQEAITNAIKHGKAKFINLSLEKTVEGVTLTITDDGIGLPEKPVSSEGMGLRIMAYRAGMIDASFKIERLPESGTRVSCKLPAGRSDAKPTHVTKN